MEYSRAESASEDQHKYGREYRKNHRFNIAFEGVINIAVLVKGISCFYFVVRSFAIILWFKMFRSDKEDTHE